MLGASHGQGERAVAAGAMTARRRAGVAAAFGLFVLLVMVGCSDDGNQVVVPTSGGGSAPSASADRTTRTTDNTPTTTASATTGDADRTTNAPTTERAPTTDAATTRAEATTTRATETTKAAAGTTEAAGTTKPASTTTTAAAESDSDDSNATPWIIAAIAAVAAVAVGVLALRNRSQSASMKSQQSKAQIDTVGAAADSALELVAFRRSARFDPANAAAASIEVERRAEQATALANQAALDEATAAPMKPLFADVAAAGRALTQAELSDRALRVGPPAPTPEQIQYSESITDQRAQQLADATARLRASVAPTAGG